MLQCETWLSYLFCRLEEIRYHSRPAGLMAGTDATPAITVKVLMVRYCWGLTRQKINLRISIQNVPIIVAISTRSQS